MESFPCKIVGDLLRFSKFSDVTFVIDGVYLKLHKSILAASCVYFETLLFGNTNESKQSVIHLKQTPLKLFKGIVEFIYTGVVVKNQYTQGETIALLTLAHEYQLEELIEYLSPKIKLDTDLPTAINYLDFAVKCNVSELKDRCLIEIDRNVSKISDQNFFKNLPANVVIEITKRDTFGIDELKLFQLLNMWKSVHSNVNISEAFHNIRLNLLSPENFAKHVQPTKFLNSDDYVKCLLQKLPKRKGANGNIKTITVNSRNGRDVYMPHNIFDETAHLYTHNKITVQLEKQATVSKMTLEVAAYTNCIYQITVGDYYQTMVKIGNIRQTSGSLQIEEICMSDTPQPVTVIEFKCTSGEIKIPLRSIVIELN